LVYINGGSGKRWRVAMFLITTITVLIGSNLHSLRACWTKKKPLYKWNQTFRKILLKISKWQILKLVQSSQTRYFVYWKKINGRVSKWTNSYNDPIHLKHIIHIKRIRTIERQRDFECRRIFDGMQMQDNDRMNVSIIMSGSFSRKYSLSNFSVSSHDRSFLLVILKITNKTFTKFVNDYRLVHASKLLAEKPIHFLKSLWKWI
jgi:hypothetical protein